MFYMRNESIFMRMDILVRYGAAVDFHIRIIIKARWFMLPRASCFYDANACNIFLRGFTAAENGRLGLGEFILHVNNDYGKFVFSDIKVVIISGIDFV